MYVLLYHVVGRGQCDGPCHPADALQQLGVKVLHHRYIVFAQQLLRLPCHRLAYQHQVRAQVPVYVCVCVCVCLFEYVCVCMCMCTCRQELVYAIDVSRSNTTEHTYN